MAQQSLDRTPAGDIAPDEAALWHRWRGAADTNARTALIAHFLPYARVIGAVLYGRRTHDEVGFDDYHQWACVGLVEAVDRYDPAAGAQFKTFAAYRMRGAILNGLERATEKTQQIAAQARWRSERLKDVASMAASAGSASLLDYLAEVGIGMALSMMLEGTGMVEPREAQAASAPSPEIGYFRASALQSLRETLRSRIADLPAGARRVIEYHYQQDIPFERIAVMTGVSRGRVSQLHRQGLELLRQALSHGSACDLSL